MNMSGTVYGTRECEGTSLVGEVTDYLCDSISFLFSRPKDDVDSMRCVEATAKEFHEKLMAMSEDDKVIVVNTMIDIFTKDIISTDEFIGKLANMGRCSGMALLLSQANYETSLPPTHGKAFLKKKVQCSLENLRQAYEHMGKSMIGIADDEKYAKLLISHMVIYRSLCNYEAVLDSLKKRRVDVEDIYENIFETSVAVIRVCAMALDKYSLDEMQSTHAKMLAGEPLFVIYNENGEAIS